MAMTSRFDWGFGGLVESFYIADCCLQIEWNAERCQSITWCRWYLVLQVTLCWKVCSKKSLSNLSRGYPSRKRACTFVCLCKWMDGGLCVLCLRCIIIFQAPGITVSEKDFHIACTRCFTCQVSLSDGKTQCYIHNPSKDVLGIVCCNPVRLCLFFDQPCLIDVCSCLSTTPRNHQAFTVKSTTNLSCHHHALAAPNR